MKYKVLGAMLCVVALGFSIQCGAKMNTLDKVSLPSSVMKYSANPQVMTFTSKGDTVQQAMRVIGIDSDISYQLMKKDSHNYYYAIMGEGRMLPYGWGEGHDTPTQSSETLEEPMVGTAYSVPIHAYATKKKDGKESAKPAVEEKREEPVATRFEKTLGFSALRGPKDKMDMPLSFAVQPVKPATVEDWLAFIKKGNNDFQLYKPFVKRGSGAYVGAIKTKHWYNQVAYEEIIHLMIGEQSYRGVKIRYLIHDAKDEAQWKGLDGLWK